MLPTAQKRGLAVAAAAMARKVDAATMAAAVAAADMALAAEAATATTATAAVEVMVQAGTAEQLITRAAWIMTFPRLMGNMAEVVEPVEVAVVPAALASRYCSTTSTPHKGECYENISNFRRNLLL